MFGNVIFAKKHHSTRVQLVSMKRNAFIIQRPEVAQLVYGLLAHMVCGLQNA
jgi:hypothetical protein